MWSDPHIANTVCESCKQWTACWKQLSYLLQFSMHTVVWGTVPLKDTFFFFSMILLYQLLPELHARTSFYLHKNQRWPWKVNETNWGKIATAACWEKIKCYLKTISSKAIPPSALHYCLLPWDSQSILGKTWASGIFFCFLYWS